MNEWQATDLPDGGWDLLVLKSSQSNEGRGYLVTSCKYVLLGGNVIWCKIVSSSECIQEQ